MPCRSSLDLAVIGAGAAGLAAGIAAAESRPGLRVAAFDGAARIGAKILISGGGRCNVSNRTVTADDFSGGPRTAIARVLRGFAVRDTVAWFERMGVGLHEEAEGKLFPDSGRARTVVDALVAAAGAAGVTLVTGCRVQAIERRSESFVLDTAHGTVRASRVALATGGLSVPKTGSDGSGYAFARALGHSIIPTTPALVPLVLGDGFHADVSGVSQPVEVRVAHEGRPVVTCAGALLWTHTGVSGPAVLDASRHWHRAVHDGRVPDVTLNLCPGHRFETLEARLLAEASARPRATLESAVGALMPASVAALVVRALALDGSTRLAHLSREDRRRLVHALLAWRLDVRGSRGYAVAEVTAGGVPLDEIDTKTMESKACPGLFVIGEVLDADGRIGGFNFQWAWATGWAAGRAIAARETRRSPRTAR